MSTVNTAAPAEANHPRVRTDWLASWQEPVLEPDLPIVDAHHHLWNRRGWPYMVEDLTQDLASGHNVVSTVFVESRTHYRSDGPVESPSVGEVEFAVACAASVAEMAGELPRVCEGIIGHADLRLGSDVASVLDALNEASGGRFCGVRHSSAWDIESGIVNPELGSSPDLIAGGDFRRAIDLLGRRGLVYDAWVYHPQLYQIADLADACPNTQIVLDHAGGPLGIGRYQGRRSDAFKEWRQAMRVVASRPNVAVKIGGMAMRVSGYDFHIAATPPSSEEVARTFRPYVEVCLALFGPARCMFESNFPVDKASYSYCVLWNAFKRIASDLSDAEKTKLFSGTATRIYQLGNRVPGWTVGAEAPIANPTKE
jgi:predicted TIM-barrel fold metal-dependent hydrolase